MYARQEEELIADFGRLLGFGDVEEGRGFHALCSMKRAKSKTADRDYRIRGDGNQGESDIPPQWCRDSQTVIIGQQGDER